MAAWLLNTALGRALCVSAIVLLCWWGFSSYYEAKGREQCKAAATAGYVKQEDKGRDIAQAADKAIDDVEKRADEQRTVVVTEIKTVYRDRPAGPPVAPGSCVYPVDERVQAALQAQLDHANGVTP